MTTHTPLTSVSQQPMFAGSGLKGALRHHFNRAWPRAEGDERKPSSLINRIFGPDTGASDFAGALSLSDAQPGIGGKLLQIGGDATTGRGLVMVQSAPSEPNLNKES